MRLCGRLTKDRFAIMRPFAIAVQRVTRAIVVNDKVVIVAEPAVVQQGAIETVGRNPLSAPAARL